MTTPKRRKAKSHAIVRNQSKLRFKRSLALATATAAVLALGLGMLPTVNAVTARANSLGNTCKVDPKHPKLQDQEGDDIYPWKRNGAKQVTVYFVSSKVTATYKTDMQFAARVWSRSNCIEVKIVNKCPSKGYCVPVSLKKSGGENVEGLYEESSSGNYMTKGSIEFYTDEMNDNTPNERKSTVIHEMGHALGLGHRKSEKTVMAGVGNDGIIKLDAIDFQNLRVLYGKQK